jgi:hypothetical protein
MSIWLALLLIILTALVFQRRAAIDVAIGDEPDDLAICGSVGSTKFNVQHFACAPNTEQIDEASPRDFTTRHAVMLKARCAIPHPARKCRWTMNAAAALRGQGDGNATILGKSGGTFSPSVKFIANGRAAAHDA